MKTQKILFFNNSDCEKIIQNDKTEKNDFSFLHVFEFANLHFKRQFGKHVKSSDGTRIVQKIQIQIQSVAAKRIYF